MPIEHDPGAHRFFTEVEGHEAEVSYRLQDGVMSITHTGVPDAIGGRGIAGHLNRAAFDFARENGMRVRPVCAYAAAWAKRHPEYGDILG